jgi:uncharacterized protein (DUF1778 family)
MSQEYLVCDKKGKKVTSSSGAEKPPEDNSEDEEVVLKECAEAKAPAYRFVRMTTTFPITKIKEEDLEIVHALLHEEPVNLTEEEIKKFLAKFSKPMTKKQKELWKRAREAVRDIKPL